MTVPASPSAVVDASALLAYLFDESGGERFVRAIGGSPVMSAVNWSEVTQKTTAGAVPPDALRAAVLNAGLQITPFGAAQAESTAALWDVGRPLGLALADRACLALAIERRCAAVTGDRAWTRLDIPGLSVRCLR